MPDKHEPSRITKGYKRLISDAAEVVDTYPTADAIERFSDDDVTFVDVRDPNAVPGSQSITGVSEQRRY